MLKVLFVCTGNSCRSQMAEGWAKALLDGQLESYSAGTETHGLNPMAVRAMAESGVDISTHHSKTLDDLSNIKFDLIVTVCDNAASSCPTAPPGTRVIHVPFDDPPRLVESAINQADAMQHYRRVRDEIKDFVLTLPSILESGK